jgi:superfamily I DNA/RNA helicase
MAGPGTGKTFALMRKVSRLLETGSSPSSILVVSFTRTAANDLISHLRDIGSPGADLVIASTLHKLSFSLLAKNSVFRTTHRVPRPLMEFEAKTLVNDLADKYGGKRRTKTLLHAFEAYWARLQHQQPGWPQIQEEQDFNRDLMHWLIYHKAMLIGELVPRALDFIKSNPASRDIPSYAHVLVDEYQDLNRADQELIDALARNGTLTVIGDEDQAIYTSLRFAQPEGITQFNLTHANTHDEPLNVCKRCPSIPIQMANTLILHNHPMCTSTICPSADCGQGEIYIVQHDFIQDEIETISAYINWYLLNHDDVGSKDILVLSTRRMIGYAIRNELLRLGLNARSYFTEECLEKNSAISGVCLLRLLVNSNDSPSLRAWLGLNQSNWRSPAYKRLWQAAEADGITTMELLNRIQNGSANRPIQIDPIISRYDELLRTIPSLIGIEINQLIDILWPDGNTECEDIRNLALAVATDANTPEDLLEGLISAITQPELPEGNEDIIRIMSLHKSKGLTAKCVLVVGCVAGALPNISSGLSVVEQQKVIEEQRRLFYVAITRTTNTLVISNSARTSYAAAMHMGLDVVHHRGRQAYLQSSPFISELGPQAQAMLSGEQWRSQVGF